MAAVLAKLGVLISIRCFIVAINQCFYIAYVSLTDF